MEGFARQFDYVIVGAGSAGCVLANRLSADSSKQVCLVEAGPKGSSIFMKVPLGLMALYDHPVFNWRFMSDRQSCAGDRRIYIPKGKGLGGSSSINGMVYSRGHPDDYDDWARMGNHGWSYEDVLPYFRKSEHNENFPASRYHGQGGEINVRFLDSYNPLTEVMLQAAEELQYPRNPDYCAETHEGFSPRQVMQKNGLRVSSATAFLDPVRDRDNLTVITDASVSRVLLEDRRATGVELIQGQAKVSLEARREVVLAAGAVGSPQILQLSGIGSRDLLMEKGVELHHHLPGVGENLQDHFNAQLQYLSPTTASYGISMRNLPYNAWQVIRYLVTRKGLLSSNAVESGGFVRTTPAELKPDLQLILVPALQSAVLRQTRRKGRRQRMWRYGHGFSIMSCLMRPDSRGSVRIRSEEPLADPTVDLNLLSDPEGRDIAALAAGLRIARRLAESKPFAEHRGPEKRPGPETQTDEELHEYIRKSASTNFHLAGSCKMGPDTDDMAVVDAELKVRGINRLRVADASIMPRVVGGNTHAPTVMIAEKASEMIRAAV